MQSINALIFTFFYNFFTIRGLKKEADSHHDYRPYFLSTIPPAQPDACYKTYQTCSEPPPSLHFTEKWHRNHLLRLKDRPTRPAIARASTTIICPTKLNEQNQPHVRTKIFHTVQTSSIVITPLRKTIQFFDAVAQ